MNKKPTRFKGDEKMNVAQLKNDSVGAADSNPIVGDGYDIDSDELLTRDEVLAIVKMSESNLYRLIGIGVFPKPFRIGEHAVRWRKSTVSDYITSRLTVA